MIRQLLPGLCGVTIGAVCAIGTVQPRVSASPQSRTLAASQVPQGSVTWDFETGNLIGWQAVGNAFANQPTFGDNTTARKSAPANAQGSFWIGTFENYQGKGRGLPGGSQGDRPRGSLTSVTFTVPASLTFRIGGGSSSLTRVELLVGEIGVISASGRGIETMQDVSWDLTKWAGRRGQIRIVDESSEPGGHINVDDFRFGGLGRGRNFIADLNQKGGDREVPAAPPQGDRPAPPTPEKPATVPDLSGMNDFGARLRLALAGLNAGKVTREESNTRQGQVFRQSPVAGTQVVRGSAVDFSIALPRPVVVPLVVGYTQREAAAILGKADLQPGKITRQPSTLPEGQVLEQGVPARQTVPSGTAVPLTIAAPVKPVRIPNLNGRTDAEARELLAKARLVPGTIANEESNTKEGRVFKQMPARDTEVPPNTAVDFWIAVRVAVKTPVPPPAPTITPVVPAPTTAPTPPPVVYTPTPTPSAPVTTPPVTTTPTPTPTPIPATMPDLIGRTDREARDLLAKAGLVPGKVANEETNSDPDRVFKQDPASRTQLVAGTAVGFTLAIPITVPVPPLIGLNVNVAIEILKKSGLTSGNIDRQQSRSPKDSVIVQGIAAGTRVPTRSAVNLTLADLIRVRVPSLRRTNEEAASELLKKAELTLGSVSSEESREPEGTVLSQRPAAFSDVTIGTPVSIVIAKPVTVLVPALVNLSQDDARALLSKLELEAGVVTTAESRNTIGTVLSQRPVTGIRVTIGSAVNFEVATPVTVLVPNVVESPEADARKALGDVELRPGVTTVEEARTTAGSVLRQSVAAGTRVPIGTTVDLVTAIRVTVLVPRLTGTKEVDARQALASAELLAEVQYEESAAERDTVLRQFTDAGTRVPINTAVLFIVAAIETVPMPSVVGLGIEQARQALVARRLAVGSVPVRAIREVSRDRVLEQGVEPGTRIPVGTAVALTVSTPEIVVVPQIVGLQHEAALGEVGSAGLSIRQVARRISLSAGGTIVAQDLVPGARVEYGTLVGVHEAMPRSIWMIPGFAGLAMSAGLLDWRRRRRTRDLLDRTTTDTTGPVPPINVSAKPHVDLGEAAVRRDDPQAIKLEIRIAPSAGTIIRHIDRPAGNLITGERRLTADQSQNSEGTS